MKLLILTQAVDLDNPALGFFHTWIELLSKKCEHITVVCLGKGRYSLPENVNVISLGKEHGRSKLEYIVHFYKNIWQERSNYDQVFVHMNQEYVLLGGLFWKLWNKKIFLWRNHPLGNFLTTISVFLADKVFCTSEFSYTARFKKTIVMPVGINTDHFKNVFSEHAERQHTILFFGRIDPIKRPEIFIDALEILSKSNKPTEAVFVGAFFDSAYEEKIQTKIRAASLERFIHFHPSVTQKEAPAVLSMYEIYINTTPTGSMDKAIFEAMACETLVLTSNRALQGKIGEEFLFKEEDAKDLAHKISILMNMSSKEKKEKGQALREFVIRNHSLDVLFEKLIRELNAAH